MTSLRRFVVSVMTLLMTLTIPLTSAQRVINMTASGGAYLPITMATSPRVGASPVTDAVIDLISQSCIFEEDYLFLRRLAYLETADGTAARTYGQSGYYGGIWRVDEAMFRRTQANTPQLQTKYAAIRDVFGIDWMKTQWQDLQKPLYSGLAAALYTFLQGHIPLSVEQQGRYVHEHYNSADTAFNYTMASQQAPVCDRRPHVDLAFLLDATTSGDDFLRMRDFVRKVMESPLGVTGGNIRVSVYQFGGRGSTGSPALQKNIDHATYTSSQQLLSLIGGLNQAKVPNSALDIGQAVTSVLYDSFSPARARPLSAKMVIVLTDKASSSDPNILSAAQKALAQGVTVMAVGVGSQANGQQLGKLVTAPVCRHRLMVPSSRDLVDIVQLVQRTICNEPMIAQGMVHCAIEDCRNVAFPLTSPLTTLIANVTCDDGRVFVTTRMPRPGRGFEDFSGLVDSADDATYVTFHDVRAKFLYADLFGVGSTTPGCVATLSTANGIVGQPKEPTCNDWKYPTNNPCEAPGRKTSRFPYHPDPGMFIQCDLRNHMYLTHCPPGEPFYSAECEVCAGGPTSPSLTGCKGAIQNPNTPYCGLDHNPCTKDNILQDHLFFACPVNESYYLQCNIWGHGFVKRCPQHQVWRQQSLTCEYENTAFNPCGTPGVRFYPYPQNPHYYIDCGADMVPNLLRCQGDLVWNSHVDTCDFPAKTTTRSPLTHLTNAVTLPPSRAPVSHGTPNPSTGLLSRGFAAPCTQENVSAGKLFWPYAANKHQYIQCDLWGDAFVKSCQAGFSFDRYSSTCVDGDVAVDNHVPDGGLVG